MIRIRLSRIGKKNDPFYRIVAIEQHRKREGKPVEVLGYWHPRENVKKIDSKKYEYWISKGAKPSDAVSKLFSSKK